MSGARFNAATMVVGTIVLGALALQVLASERGLFSGRNVFSERWPSDYDEHFQKWSKRYFGPHFDWRWFKSQGIVESRLEPRAVSPMGAVGIMQILPSTYEEIQSENPYFQDITDPRWNIGAAIYYDRDLYRKWRKPLPSGERLLLAFASYNAGYGRVLKALRRAPDQAGRWDQVEQHLPRETRAYVQQIQDLMDLGVVSRRKFHGVEELLIRRAQSQSDS
jgi:membrane-bound lytic murein transglycosylase MltF